jgi:hypothetical protein
MPRRHRSARDRPGPTAPAPAPVTLPTWAQATGYEVRIVPGEKPYRCPGCDHEIRQGVQHLVVVPEHDPDDRRHWHENCWRQELRRTRRG